MLQNDSYKRNAVLFVYFFWREKNTMYLGAKIFNWVRDTCSKLYKLGFSGDDFKLNLNPVFLKMINFFMDILFASKFILNDLFHISTNLKFKC